MGNGSQLTVHHVAPTSRLEMTDWKAELAKESITSTDREANCEYLQEEFPEAQIEHIIKMSDPAWGVKHIMKKLSHETKQAPKSGTGSLKKLANAMILTGDDGSQVDDDMSKAFHEEILA